MNRVDARPDTNVVPLPEPPGKRTRRLLLIISGSVVALILALIVVLLYSPLLAVKNIEVSGNDLAKQSAVQEALEPLVGTPLPRIGPASVLRLLEGQPAVRDVVVQAEAPSTLRVEIVEHQPVAIVESKGKYRLVGEDGRTLAALAKRDGADLPVIDAESAVADPKVFATVTEVLASLPESVLNRLDKAGAKTIDSVELKLTNGKTVLWGNSERNADKAGVVTALLRVREEPNTAAVKVYDVTSPDHPVTR